MQSLKKNRRSEGYSQNKEGLYQCPCCDKYTLGEAGSFDDCLNCGWEDDLIQKEEPDLSGANKMSLNEARKAYKEGKKIS